jgi:sugar (glycoside-pentoside-hexuronide) transporter
MAQKKISKLNLLLFSFAGFGQNIVYAMMITYVIDYFTLKLGVIAGVVMLAARILDAVKDPVMGSLMDKTDSKYGKLRPYFLIVPLPLAITTILLYFIPPMPLALQAVYAFTIFFLWGCSYTMGDISYLGAPASMTDNSTERVNLISISRLLCTLGGALPTLIVPIILENMANKATAYLISAIIFSISGSLLFLLAFISAKEVIRPTIERFNVKESLKMMKADKPLILILIATLLGYIRGIIQSIGIIVARVNFGSDTYFIYMALSFGAALAIGTLIVPPLIKRFEVKKTFIGANIFAAIVQIIFYFIGYHSFPAVLVILFFTGLPFGVYNTLLFSIPVDSMDYLEWKTGKRAEGLAFSLQTFTGKVGSGILLLIGSLSLVFAGYGEGNLNGPKVADGLFKAVTIIPFIGIILSTIPMLFYDYEGELKSTITAELSRRRSNI